MKRLRTMEEVEDTTNLANCLRLLSKPDQTTAHRDFECKTCHRQFPSFQALGGHRASHKKPQLVHNKQTQGPASSVREHRVIRDIELAFSYFGGSRTTNTGSTPMYKLQTLDATDTALLFGKTDQTPAPRELQTLDATDLALLFRKTDQTTAPRVFECKTCNRQFHSFQALGGHRASHKKPQLVHNKQTQGPASSVREHRGIRDIELGLPNFGGSSNTGSTPMGPASSVREHRGIRDIELPFSYFGGSRTTNTGSTPMREGGKHDQDPKMKDFRNFTYWITTLFITILVGLLSVNERQPELLFRSCSSLAIGATICCIAMLMLILIRPSSQRALTCLKMMQYLTVGLLFVAAVLVFTLL